MLSRCSRTVTRNRRRRSCQSQHSPTAPLRTIDATRAGQQTATNLCVLRLTQTCIALIIVVSLIAVVRLIIVVEFLGNIRIQTYVQHKLLFETNQPRRRRNKNKKRRFKLTAHTRWHDFLSLLTQNTPFWTIEQLDRKQHKKNTKRQSSKNGVPESTNERQSANRAAASSRPTVCDAKRVVRMLRSERASEQAVSRHAPRRPS